MTLLLFILLLPQLLWGEHSSPPLKPLLQLLDAFGAEHDGSWDSIMQTTQSQWLMKGSRWEFPPREDPHPERTYSLFTELGMTGDIHATRLCYDYAVVLGATESTVQGRLDFLKEEWDRGVCFATLVLLTGDRPIDPKIENAAYKNETEMMTHLAEGMHFSEVNIIVVDTPCPAGKTRPDTAATFHQWMSLGPTPGSCLILSSQPFVARQDLIARKLLPGTFCIETIGKGFTFETYLEHKNGLTILLDELARWIYEFRTL